MQEANLRCVGSLVIDLFAAAAAGQKAALREAAQMVRDRRAGHLQHRGDVDDAFLVVAEQPEDADPGRVAQLLEDLADGTEMLDIHQLPVQIFRVLLFAVIVRQRKTGHGIFSFYPFWKFHSPFRKHPSGRA